MSVTSLFLCLYREKYFGRLLFRVGQAYPAPVRRTSNTVKMRKKGELLWNRTKTEQKQRISWCFCSGFLGDICAAA